MRAPVLFLLFVITLLLWLTILMVLPFLQFFLLAVLLAYLLAPLQRRLEQKIGSRFAAGLIVLLSAVVIVLPLVYFTWIAVQEATTIVDAIQEEGITFSELEDRIEEELGVQIDLAGAIQSAAGEIDFIAVVGILDTVFHAVLGVGLTLFLLYYFLKDRDHFLHWLRETMPVPDDVQDQIYEEVDLIMKAVLVGHVLVAIVQALLAGIGLAVTGVPNATFWTIVMIVLALLPIIGSFLVWGPAAIYLFLEGELLFAALLFIWGATVVGVSDDYLRPIVVDRYAQVNPAVIIVGVFGGVFVIGLMGIFFGPLIIGILKGTLDVFRDEYADELRQLS